MLTSKPDEPKFILQDPYGLSSLFSQQIWPALNPTLDYNPELINWQLKIWLPTMLIKETSRLNFSGPHVPSFSQQPLRIGVEWGSIQGCGRPVRLSNKRRERKGETNLTWRHRERGLRTQARLRPSAAGQQPVQPAVSWAITTLSMYHNTGGLHMGIWSGTCAHDLITYLQFLHPR